MKFIGHFKNILEKVDLMGTKPSDYTKKLRKQAKKVESEHSNSVSKQIKTGMEHAAEFPKEVEENGEDKIGSDYYDELEKLENKLKKKTTKSFKEIVDDVVKENTMASGAGGVFGPNASTGSTWNNGQSGDTIAPGDARNIYGFAKEEDCKCKKGKKCKCKSKTIMPVVRRTFPKT